MNNFFLTVGIEIHTQVNTKTKMFSNTSICNDTTIENINKFVNEYDLGMPGVLPSINEEVIKKAIIFANALEMKINKNLRFDRKNYYYQDLPKGYQITQNFFPFAIEGKIKISNKSIGINRFHLEEDTAKQIIDNEKIILDYNRSGIPLIEIVSEPEMHSSDEVIEYLQKIKQILTFLEISDGEMENSSLRVDVNISVSKNNLEKGIRVEIKNLNSFSNVRDAINYEFERQVKLINSGSHVDQETRKWDEKKRQTIFMRNKKNSIDYKYCAEPNILPIDISNIVDNIKLDKKSLPCNIAIYLEENGLNKEMVNLLLNDYKIYKVFQYANKKINDFNLCASWILVELTGVLKEIKIYELNEIKLNNIIDLILLIKSQEINNKQGKVLLQEIIKSDKNAKELIIELNFKQITDKNIITKELQEIINNNKELIIKNKNNYEKIKKIIIGQLMKITNGQANPVISNQILEELLIKVLE